MAARNTSQESGRTHPPWVHVHGRETQEFGTVRMFPLGLERVQTLGGVAVGDPRHVAEITTVPRPPDGAEEVPAMLSRLIQAHEMVLDAAHKMAARTQEMGDDGTNDLLVSDVIRTGELQTWFMLRAPSSLGL